MSDFLYQIYNFLRDLNASLTNSLSGSNLTKYTSFLDKPVFFESSWLGLNITYFELIFYVGSWLIAILSIVLFIKFVFKILALFRFR